MAKDKDKTKDKDKIHPAHDFRDAVCGKVHISFNQEDEVKTAIVATGKYVGREHVATNALWKAYVQEKTNEWRQSFDRRFIRRKSGQKLMTPLHAETKPYRERFFQTTAGEHPANIEIRVEGLVTMIKIATPKHKDSSVLSRLEIRIQQQFPGLVPLDEIPGDVGKSLARQFNHGRARFFGATTESWREKITAPILTEWRNNYYVVDYERAKDIGALVSMAGHKSDITEIEGEVKHIYKYDDYANGKPVDIKKAPEYAGLTHADIKVMVDDFLHARLENFMGFANGWFAESRFKDCSVVPVTISKSQPAIDGLHQVLAAAPVALRESAVMEAAQSQVFKVNPALSGLRRQMP